MDIKHLPWRIEISGEHSEYGYLYSIYDDLGYLICEGLDHLDAENIVKAINFIPKHKELIDALDNTRHAISAILGDGGVDPDIWFDDLVKTNRNSSVVINSCKEIFD